MMISRLLQDGKKSIAARVFYESLDKIGVNVSSGRTTSDSKGSAGSMPRGSDKSAVAVLGTDSSANLSKDTSSEALKIFQQAVLHVTPLVEVKSRRVGGSNYQVPLEVNSERGTALALRWIVQAARQRPGREMASKLANEFMDASNKTGNAVRKREETHRMAEANKAFANYRF